MDRISLILDKSGSMSPKRADTIGGVNTFVRDQVRNNPNALFSLTLFDTEVTIVHTGVRVDAVPELTDAVYSPSGNTALLDAIGTTMASLERESGPDDHVLICIVTDGEENSSREWKLDSIKALLTTKQDLYGWGVLYLGASVDAFAEAHSMGIARASTSSYQNTGIGTTTALNAASTSTHAYFRTGKAEIKVPTPKVVTPKKVKVSTPK